MSKAPHLLDAATRDSRLGFLGIEGRTVERLAELGHIIHPHMGALVVEWHEYLAGRPELGNLFNKALGGNHSKESQLRGG